MRGDQLNLGFAPDRTIGESKANRFVTPYRKNLKTQYNYTQKLSPGVGGRRRERPDDHPQAMRAAWEARRRSNHPPEMQRRHEERAAMWEHMRGWRPKFGRRYWTTADGYRRAAAISSQAASEAAMIEYWRKRQADDAAADLAIDRAQELAELAKSCVTESGDQAADLSREQKEKISSPFIFNNLKKSARGGGGDRGGASPQPPPPSFGETTGREAAQESTSQTTGREAAQESAAICPRCDNPAGDREAAQGRPRMAVVGGRVVVCPRCGGTGERRA
jgi:hypothetical protein